MSQPQKSVSIEQPNTLVDLLRSRAHSKTGDTAYTFLADGLIAQASLTYGELDRRARAIASALQSQVSEGDRVLLLLPPGLDYIAAFFACLYAKAVAVPAYPGRSSRKLARAESAAIDSGAALALTADQIYSRIKLLLEDSQSLGILQWLTVEEALTADENAWREPHIDGDSLAFLQYTSGSTLKPRGVMVSHRKLLNNEEFIRRAFNQSEESIIVGWLPLYHDMGLIGNVLQPLYLGAQCILMSPMSFLQRPLVWLQAISRYRATTSGGPNFAYDLCVRRINADDRKSLDLSSWTLAFNGAEPVRQETMEQFVEAFSKCGFRREAFYPCYGLAEATLLVSAGRYLRQGEPAVKTLAAKDLEHHRVRMSHDAEGKQVVSCGPTHGGQRILIVDPETRVELAAGAVGEIWVSGPSVASRYWNRPEESEQVFAARLADSGEGPFLRTGDLGFVHENELFVTGRLKDMIIIRGLNHYPQDIELTVQQCEAGFSAGAGAAFSVEVAGEERLVVVQETDRHNPLNFDEVSERIRRAVAENHELHVYSVVFVRSGSIPKTPSGKVQRHACRESFLDGTLKEVFRVVIEGEIEWITSSEKRLDLLATPIEERAGVVREYLLARLAKLVRPAPSIVDVQQSLTALGLDSLAAVELRNQVESDLGVNLEITEFLGDESIQCLEEQILGRIESEDDAQSGESSVDWNLQTAEQPLSQVQRALWFIHQLAPESPAYNLAFALRLLPRADPEALRGALQILTNRHSSLRTIFTNRDGEPVRRELETAELSFEVKNAAGLTGKALAESLQAGAYRPFDLEHGPVFKSVLFKDSAEGDVLLLAVHHIVFDGWSLWVLLDELAILYEDGLRGVSTRLPQVGATYNSFVRRQSEIVDGAEGLRLLSYWRRELDGQLPVLALPTFKPRPAFQTFRGASHAFDLDVQLCERLKALSRAEGTTLNTVLLAVFQILLYRYTGQEDFVVGSPTSSRGRGDFDQVIGCFFNAVVLRAKLEADLSFREHLKRVRSSVLGALAHQDYPSHLLAERLEAARDGSRPPLFQVSFIFQKPHRSHTAVQLHPNVYKAATQPEPVFAMQLLPLERHYVRTDLELEVLDAGICVQAQLNYNTDLFDATAISRMAGHFLNLLSGAVDNPEQSVDRLRLVSESEIEILIDQWSGSGNSHPNYTYINEGFGQQAALNPLQVAAFKDGAFLTYRQLEKRSNSLANLLQELIR